MNPLDPAGAAGHDLPGAGWDAHLHVFDAAAPVRAGHYRPAHRPLAQAQACADALGVRHLVLVQPSVYGTDHGVLLAALRAGAGRHRGIAVLDAGADDATLDTLHAAGVRGVRINRVSPVGHAGDAAADHAHWSARLAERGWHLQWYVRPHELPRVARLHAGGGATAVLDHLGGLTAAYADDHAAWDALARLADGGAWIKLSGWYRLDADAPYATLRDTVRRVAALFGDRMVWGSDWPHTGLAAGATPDYATTWAPVPAALGDAAARRVLSGAARLYR